MTKGQRIAELRTQKKMSQSELSKSLNVSPSTIGMWETDQRAIKDDDLLRIANFFNVSTDYLLGKSNIKSPEIETLAFHQSKDLTDEQQKEVDKFIDFIKNRDKE